MTSAANHWVGCRVLLVEDDYLIANAMDAEFETLGAEVIGPAASVKTALELIAAHELDAAVLDINLHEVMRYPVAEALLARGVPFVFATSYYKAALPERYAHVPHCEKPVEPSQLARALFV
ncbi:response regulator [Methylorubrum extorquens]|uniref:response regulator n=1 Tax=Methylorubrum extorquens TaxID=408 RepID=UPI0006FAB2B6|nr:response regulator [Methylorubrum extorquens]KQO85499.1 hypothetical protein ASF36_25240 [Methylobacterium sp. Leaf90]UYW33492.1 response regulator [Methylorubrum extorquens]